MYLVVCDVSFGLNIVKLNYFLENIIEQRLLGFSSKKNQEMTFPNDHYRHKSAYVWYALLQSTPYMKEKKS